MEKETDTICSYASKLAVSLLILMSIGAPAHAQTPSLPSTVDPSRLEEQLPVPSAPVAPPLIEKQKPVLQGAAAPEGADQYMFTLRKLTVEGATVYKTGDLENLADHMIGNEISVASLYTLAAKITQRYHEDGYVLSQAVIPQQEITDGSVTIAVIEGYAMDVVLQGDDVPSFPANNIVKNIKSMRPLNLARVERALLILDEMAGTSARAVFEPLKPAEAEKYPGAAKLNIIFTKRAAQTSLSIDNGGSKFVGPWQGRLHTDIPHDFLFRGQTSFDIASAQRIRELLYFSMAENVLVSSGGLRLNGGFKYSRSEPGSSLDVLDLYSRYQSLTFGAEYPLILTRESRLDVFGNFEANNIQSDIISSRLYDDRLRIIRIGGKYSVNDRWGGANVVNISFAKGLDILGARETGSLDLSRAEGHSDFSKFEAALTHLHPLGGHVTLRTMLLGQYAFSPLLSSEEFGFGGSQIGRGYDNAEITGDSGIAFSTELSYNGLSRPYGSAEPFIFYDAGKAWNRDSDGENISGASAGGGLRLNIGPARFSLTAAKPLTKSAANPTYGNGQSPRYLFSAEVAF